MSTAAPVVPAVPADLPPRIAARAIDALVLVALDVGLGRRIGFGFDWLIIGAAIVLVYFTLLDAFAGATLGKAALGLRVIGPEGARPSLRQALVREAVTIIGAIPLVGPLLALAAWTGLAMSIRANPLRQGNHDRFAGGTRVISVRAR